MESRMTHYIPITDADRIEMMKTIGVERLEDLFEAVPAEHRFPPLQLPEPLSEPELRRS
jgi:glycine dehydrogenase (decarboxylating) alpha subunit (EC 1.4.4.2)